MKINDLAPSKKTKLVIFIVRSDDKCLTLTASVTEAWTYFRSWKLVSKKNRHPLRGSDFYKLI